MVAPSLAFGSEEVNSVYSWRCKVKQKSAAVLRKSDLQVAGTPTHVVDCSFVMMRHRKVSVTAGYLGRFYKEMWCGFLELLDPQHIGISIERHASLKTVLHGQ